MDLPIITYKKEEYVVTASGHKIFKSPAGHICGTQNIVLTGKAIIMKDVILRGDLSTVKLGKYGIVKTGTIIRPCHRKFSKGFTMFPVQIGEHDCLISAAQICAFVHIGAGSVVGAGAIIKECCRVLPGSVVPPEAVYPPFSTISGNPAKVIGKEPECTESLMTDVTKQFYENFVPVDASRILS